MKGPRELLIRGATGCVRALTRAIEWDTARRALTVQHSDGRRVTYRTVDELKAARAMVCDRASIGSIDRASASLRRLGVALQRFRERLRE